MTMITSVGVVITSYLSHAINICDRDLKWSRDDLQLDNMRMPQNLQILYFPFDSSIHIWRRDLCAIDKL